MEPTSRRKFITTVAGATFGAGVLNTTGCANPESKTMSSAKFKYCLNTSTIRGQNLGLIKEIEVAAQAGYEAIEPWIRTIRAYLEGGGTLKELDARIGDLGLTVESAIGFAKWIVDDPQERAAGLEEAKNDMDLLAQIGGKRIAAPPAGATKEAGLDLLQAAKRYRALLELGEKMGVTPMVEVWGFSKKPAPVGPGRIRGHRKWTSRCLPLAGCLSHLQRGIGLHWPENARSIQRASLPHQRLSGPSTQGNHRG